MKNYQLNFNGILWNGTWNRDYSVVYPFRIGVLGGCCCVAVALMYQTTTMVVEAVEMSRDMFVGGCKSGKSRKKKSDFRLSCGCGAGLGPPSGLSGLEIAESGILTNQRLVWGQVPWRELLEIWLLFLI